MVLSDILHEIREVHDIDMEALLKVMGISANEEEHTEQERAMLHSFVSGFITLPAFKVENDEIVKAVLDILLMKYQLPYSFLASTTGVSERDIKAFRKGEELPIQKKYTLAAQIFRLSNMICPFEETMQALKQKSGK